MMRPVRVLCWAVALAAVLAGGGLALSYALRNPLADLPPTTHSRPPVAANTAAETAAPVRPPRPSNAYVGSAACLECHADIYESYYGNHPMGRAMAHVNDASPLEDYLENTEFDAPPSSRRKHTLRYSVEKNGTGVRHCETLLEPDGELLYEQCVPVHYAIGSGERGRSYMTNRDGLLFMSPISWYSEKSRWDFSPGYQVRNLRFGRRILDGCVACHSGRMAPAPDHWNRFQSAPVLEGAISCERCHGPGEEHVARHRSGAYDGTPDPIVNPADLEPSRRDSVCFQCHLVGEERIARYGRTDFDFRPGDRVTDIWTIFVQGTGVGEDNTTAAVSQAEQMLASACYRKSEGALSCTSCHDPHSVPQAEDRVAFYRSRCLQCHDSGATECAKPAHERIQATVEDSCIHCHMPSIDANNVPHTSQTDHRVLRSYAPSDGVKRLGIGGLSAFRAETGEVPHAELERARGLLIAEQAEKAKKPGPLPSIAIEKLKPWLESVPDDAAAAVGLGAAHVLNNDIDAAVRSFEHALTIEPNNEEALRRLVVTCHDHGKIEQGVDYARRLVQLNPWHADDFGRLAHMLGQLGEFDEGIKVAQRALELDPGDALVHGWLAEVYGLNGNDERRRHHQQLFEKLSARR